MRGPGWIFPVLLYEKSQGVTWMSAQPCLPLWFSLNWLYLHPDCSSDLPAIHGGGWGLQFSLFLTPVPASDELVFGPPHPCSLPSLVVRALHHSDRPSRESAAKSVVSRQLRAAVPTDLPWQLSQGYTASELLRTKDWAWKGTRSRPLFDVDFQMRELCSGAPIGQATMVSELHCSLGGFCPSLPPSCPSLALEG